MTNDNQKQQPPIQWVPGALFPEWKWPGLTCLEAKTQSDSETIQKFVCAPFYFDKNIIQKQQAWTFPSSWVSHATAFQKRAPFCPFHTQAITEPTFKTPGYNKPQMIEYTECPRRNGQNFGRVFLMLNYTDITPNTYIQSWTVTEIMAREVWYFDSCYTLIDYQIHIKTGRNMWFL